MTYEASRVGEKNRARDLAIGSCAAELMKRALNEPSHECCINEKSRCPFTSSTCLPLLRRIATRCLDRDAAAKVRFFIAGGEEGWESNDDDLGSID